MRLLNTKLTVFVVAMLATAQNFKPAQATTVVFKNISPTAPYYQLAGNWLGTLANPYEITATTFTPSNSGQLDELTLGLIYQSGVNSVTLPEPTTCLLTSAGVFGVAMIRRPRR